MTHTESVNIRQLESVRRKRDQWALGHECKCTERASDDLQVAIVYMNEMVVQSGVEVILAAVFALFGVRLDNFQTFPKVDWPRLIRLRGVYTRYISFTIISKDPRNSYCSGCLQSSETASISPGRQDKPLLSLVRMASSADTLGLLRAHIGRSLWVYGQSHGSRAVFARVFPTGLGQLRARVLRAYSPRDRTHEGAPPEGEEER